MLTQHPISPYYRYFAPSSRRVSPNSAIAIRQLNSKSEFIRVLFVFVLLSSPAAQLWPQPPWASCCLCLSSLAAFISVFFYLFVFIFFFFIFSFSSSSSSSFFFFFFFFLLLLLLLLLRFRPSNCSFEEGSSWRRCSWSARSPSG